MRGFESTVDSRLNFGLGKTKKIDSVVVVWNDGRENILKNVQPNQQLTVKQSDAMTGMQQAMTTRLTSRNTTHFTAKHYKLRNRFYT